MSGTARQVFGVALVVSGLAAALTPLGAQAPRPAAPAAKRAWVVPRTPDGKPDLQGNWTNETQTPLERQTPGGLALTDAQAKAIEDRAQLVEEYRDKQSDPNRPPPTKGGDQNILAAPGQRSFIEQISEA